MSAIDMVRAGEQVTAANANRPLGDVLEDSGYERDGSDFAGFVAYPVLEGEVSPTVPNHPYGDPKRHGAVATGAADDRTTFANADASAQALDIGVSVSNGTYLISSNITIASRTEFSQGAKVKPASGVVITFDGAVTAGLWQIFDLSAGGTVAFGSGARISEVYAEWWGAAGDGVVDDTAALQATLDAAAPSAGEGVTMQVFAATGNYLISNTITVPNKVVFKGAGRSSSAIKAAAGFPADTAMVRLGVTQVLAFGTRLENMSVLGEGHSDYGVISDSIQEQSGVLFCLISNHKKKCIHFTSTDTVKAQNYIARDIEASLATSATASAIAVHFDGNNAAGKTEIANITTNVAGGALDVAGVGFQFDGISGHVRNLHPEHTTGGGIVIGGTTACVALTLDGVYGHSSVPTLVRFGNTQNDECTLTAIQRDNSTTTIQDDFAGLTFTDSRIGFYHTGVVNNGGVPNYPMLKQTTSTPSALAAGSNNDYALSSPRVGTVRLSGDAAGTSAITGIAGGKHGRELWMYNVSSNAVAIHHASTSSATENRFNIPTGGTVTLGVNDCALARYDGQSARWRLVNWQT